MGKRRDIRQLLAILIGAAALAVVVLIGRHFWQRQGEGQPMVGPSSLADATVSQMHITESRGGQKRWDLTAATAEYDKAADRSSLTRLRFMVFGQHSVGPMTITADRGDYHHATKDLHLVGNVRADNGKNLSFATDKVTFVGGSSLLTTTERVTLTDGNLRVEGVGMELQTNEKQVRILKRVVATITPGER